MVKRITFEISTEEHTKIHIKARRQGRSIREIGLQLFKSWLEKKG